MEVRVLELSGKGSVTAVVPSSKQLEDFMAEDSDSEQATPVDTVKSNKKVKRSISLSKTNMGNYLQTFFLNKIFVMLNSFFFCLYCDPNS